MLASLALQLHAAVPPPPPMVGTKLADAAASDGAVCLDGSPAYYYFSPGSGSGVNKWYLHHKGGGWCESLDDCVSRSRGAGGSSATYTPMQTVTDGPATMFGPYSHDPAVNPLMYNWNTVWMPYCDGASFSGSNASVTVHNGTALHFRGAHILKAIQASLLMGKQQGPAQVKLSDATDVVVSGESAGALATILHLDSWCDQIRAGNPKVKCVGLSDSGFFLDYQDPTVAPAIASGPLPNGGMSGNYRTTIPGNYRAAMRWVHDMQNTSLNAACVAAHESATASEPWLCMFAEHTIPFTKTPLFAMQSTYDSWQTAHVLKPASGQHFAPADVIQTFGANVTARVRANLLAPHPENAVFLDSCAHHCAEWNMIRIDGDLVSSAIEKWYNGIGVAGSKKTWVQGKPYPCTECCKMTYES